MHPDNPIYRQEPNGVVVLSYEMGPGGLLCQHKEWFFGPDSERAGEAYLRATLEDAKMPGLAAEGTHVIELRPAWRGDETEPHDYDDTSYLAKITYRVEHKTVLTILNQQ